MQTTIRQSARNSRFRASILALALAFSGLSLIATADAQTDETASAKPVTVTGLLDNAADNVGKQITIEGMATWVCPHMGCKAQLVNADGASKTTLLITQGKGMPKFPPELKGDTLRVTGVLREKRTTAADLDEQENEIKNPKAAAEAHNHGDGHDHAKGGDDCANCPSKQKPADPAKVAKAKEARLAQIAKYRAMLAKSKKGYLSSYTFEGQTWAKAE